MKDKIEYGIYSIDFQGNHDYEFIGNHPALIIPTIKEPEVYIIIPLSTYTPQRWEKCKKHGFGCRIISTNSIARIDKVQISSVDNIGYRWMKEDHFLVPTPEELKAVHKKLNEYMFLSSEQSLVHYRKYHDQYNEFKACIDDLINFNQREERIIEIHLGLESLIFCCGSECVKYLTVHDIKEIFTYHFSSNSIQVTNKKGKLYVNVCWNDLNCIKFIENYLKPIDTGDAVW